MRHYLILAVHSWTWPFDLKVSRLKYPRFSLLIPDHPKPSLPHSKPRRVIPCLPLSIRSSPHTILWINLACLGKQCLRRTLLPFAWISLLFLRCWWFTPPRSAAKPSTMLSSLKSFNIATYNLKPAVSHDAASSFLISHISFMASLPPLNPSLIPRDLSYTFNRWKFLDGQEVCGFHQCYFDEQCQNFQYHSNKFAK